MRGPVAAAIILSLLAGPVLSQTVKIRSGNHPDFARLVLPFAAPSKWRLGRDGKDYVLVISGDGIELDASEVYRLIPQDRVAAVQVSEAGTALRITPGCDCHVNAFSPPSGVLVIDVAEGEEAAANTIRFNDLVLMPAGFPKTREAIAAAGFTVREIGNTECAKIDGGMSCLSLRFTPR